MQALADRLQLMLGDGVAVTCSDPRAPVTGLFPEEAACVARAVPSRQASFAAGRRAARAAMASLGMSPATILQDPHGAPLWPRGVVGTISHTDHLCLAAVSHNDGRATLGIDLEAATPLDRDLHGIICTADDLEWVAAQPDPGLAAKIVFSAKEAVYKAQYPLTGKVIGFDAVSLRWDGATFTASDLAGVPVLSGTCQIIHGFILTACQTQKVPA